MGKVKSKNNLKPKVDKCEIMSHDDSDVSCDYTGCEHLNKIISTGMYLVKYGEKHFHASCARLLSIDYSVPVPKKRKRDE